MTIFFPFLLLLLIDNKSFTDYQEGRGHGRGRAKNSNSSKTGKGRGRGRARSAPPHHSESSIGMTSDKGNIKSPVKKMPKVHGDSTSAKNKNLESKKKYGK